MKRPRKRRREDTSSSSSSSESSDGTSSISHSNSSSDSSGSSSSSDSSIQGDMSNSSSSSETSIEDDTYQLAAFQDADSFLLSDEAYAEDLQLQEALKFSSSEAEDLQLQEALKFSSSEALQNCNSPKQNASSPISSNEKMKQPMVTPNEESSKSPRSRILCDICFDVKTESELFRNESVCHHVYCSDCICKHVAEKIKMNITKVTCPDPNCEGVIGPEVCRFIIPKEVLERWENALCESVILGSQKFYCPFKDCSALLVNDGSVTVTKSECPYCHRLFCAECKVGWHARMDCSDFKSLSKGDKNSTEIKLLDLAKKKKWKRCPSCDYFVAKKNGCNHIHCRCGFQFCYGCGKRYDEYHACSPY